MKGFDRKELESGVSFVDKALESYRLPSVAWDDDTYLSSGWQSDKMSLYSFRSEDVPSAEEFAMLEEKSPEQKISDMNAIALSLDKLAPSLDFPARFDGNDDTPTIWTVVQKPGDLLVIPAFWWHQTYALEPSVAIASQRCGNERDAKRVVSHIFDTIGLDNYDELPSVLKEVMDDSYTGTQKDIASALFEVLSSM